MKTKILFIIFIFAILVSFILLFPNNKIKDTPDNDLPEDDGLTNKEEQYTEGLIYELNDLNDDSYQVCGYEGAEKNVIIPEQYNGKPVTAISFYAFYKCTVIESVKIPDTVTRIYPYAFEECINLKYVELSNNINIIFERTFLGCINLTEITLPQKLTFIGEYAFADTGIRHIELPEGLTHINKGAFDNTPLTKITFPSTLESYAGCLENANAIREITIKGSIINENCFRNSCKVLRKFIIEGDVATIPANAFGGQFCPMEMYYHGTIEEFNKIVEDNALDDTRFNVVHCSDGDIVLH